MIYNKSKKYGRDTMEYPVRFIHETDEKRKISEEFIAKREYREGEVITHQGKIYVIDDIVDHLYNGNVERPYHGIYLKEEF
jgi:hypothetical protein